MPTTPEDRPLPAAWLRALEALERDGVRRGAAERTRRAYAGDLGRFARWCADRGVDAPSAVDVRTVRRYTQALTEGGAAASTVTRALSALRGAFRAFE
ncbi:site-specific integrase, partial [Patulibacter sp. S7RM1-6]